MASKKTLDTLLEKRTKLDEQIRASRARIRSEESKKRRKEDARRKIIAGALALEHASMYPDSEFALILLGLLREHVHERDRHLFALPGPDANDNSNDGSDSLSGAFKG